MSELETIDNEQLRNAAMSDTTRTLLGKFKEIFEPHVAANATAQEIQYRSAEISGNSPGALDQHGLPASDENFLKLIENLARLENLCNHTAQHADELPKQDDVQLQVAATSTANPLTPYVDQINQEAAKNGLTLQNLLIPANLKQDPDRLKIFIECMKVARDMVIAIGPEHYDQIRTRMRNSYFHLFDAAFILTGTPTQIATTFATSEQKKYWQMNPAAWAHELMLLAQTPGVAPAIIKHEDPGEIRQTFKEWTHKVLVRPTKQRKGEEEFRYIRETLKADPAIQPKIEQWIHVVQQPQKTTSRQPPNTQIRGRVGQFHNAYLRNMDAPIEAFIAGVAKFNEQPYDAVVSFAQNLVAIARKYIAQLQKDQNPGAESAFVLLENIEEAISTYETQSRQFSEITELDPTTGCKYMVEHKKGTTNIPTLKILQLNPPALIDQQLEADDLEERLKKKGVNAAIIEKAKEILEKVQSISAEKRKNYKPNVKSFEQQHTIYILMKFIQEAVRELYPEHFEKKPDAVQKVTGKAVAKTMAQKRTR